MRNIFIYLAKSQRTKSIIKKRNINDLDKLKYVILNANEFDEVGILTMVDLVNIFEKVNLVGTINKLVMKETIDKVDS